MACPKCKCQTTYFFAMDDIDEEYEMERCADCGHVFYLMDAEEDVDLENDDENLR